ncbi:hypothetical protein [Eubacterium sp. 1001713B170207_170306_E7]|uniref:hypothetical protein n=1 Tax=Eubacterium sp. 1001713B170207_170306_E7 TaxID=2787097 RepID=UPI0018987CA5|nr:hypothetical protein [Eubacterium sp. 1001713B170207_170306_E7]
MARKPATPLAYLMDMLYIQGAQLARAVHVDRTIISRWKNGRVELSPKSPYFEEIVQAIMKFNDKRGLHTLERFFASLEPGVAVDTEQDIKNCISRWLVDKEFEAKYMDKESGNSLYTATYKIYKGVTGKMDALDDMFNTLASLPKGETFWGYDADSRIFRQSNNDTRKVQKRFLDADKNKTKLITMIYLNRPQEEVYNMFEYWLPILLSTNAEAYYSYDAERPFYDYIFSIKGKQTLAGINDVNGDTYSAIYTDPMSQIQFDNFLERHLERFQPLTKNLGSRVVCNDFKRENMEGFNRNDTDQYVIATSMSFLSSGKKIIEGILMDLCLSGDEERRLIDYYDNCRIGLGQFLSKERYTRIILSLDYIQNLGQHPVIEVPVFSALLKRKVEVSGKHVIKELVSFLKFVKNDPKVQIALRPPASAELIENLNIWVKDGAAAYFHFDNDLSKRIVTEEFAAVNTFYSMVDKYWEQLPYDSKNKEWVYDQISKISGEKL